MRSVFKNVGFCHLEHALGSEDPPIAILNKEPAHGRCIDQDVNEMLNINLENE